MDRGLLMLLGMSIAYIASLAGLGLAYWGWRRHIKPQQDEKDPQQ